MSKYTFDCYGIDLYTDAVNDSAWRMLNRQDLPWRFGTEPVYPLRWYIASGRASSPFIRKLLSIRPDVIARILISGGSDQEIVSRIKARIEKIKED